MFVCAEFVDIFRAVVATAEAFAGEGEDKEVNVEAEAR